MKKMSCIDCGNGSFKAETPEEMMQAMMPHYMSEHPEMMKGDAKESREHWVKRFMKEWNNS